MDSLEVVMLIVWGQEKTAELVIWFTGMSIDSNLIHAQNESRKTYFVDISLPTLQCLPQYCA